MLAGGADAFLQGELEFLVGEFRRQSNQSSSCKRISETSEIATRERSPSQLQLGGAVQEVLDLMSATTATSTCAASQPPSAATPPHQTPASPCFTSQTSLPCRLSAPSCLLLPDDIVLSILRLLDGPNLLLSASLVCRQWRLLVVRFQVSLFSNLCKQEFNIIIDLGDNNGTPTRSPLLIYQTHFNLKHASALRFYSDTVFHLAQDLLSPSLSHSESSTDKVEELHRNDPCAEDIDKASHTTFSNSFHSHFGHIMGTRVTKNNSSASLPPNFLFAWANNPDRAYTLSLAGTSKICWIDHSSLRDILVKDLMDPDISSILFNNNKCSNDHSPPSSHSSTTTSIPFTAAQPIVLTPTHKLSFHRAPIGLILSNNAGLLVSFDDANQIAVWDVSSSSSMSLHCSIDVNRQLRESAFMFHLEQRRLQQNQPHVPGATDPGVDIYHQQDVNEGGHRDDFDEEDGIEDGLGGGLVGLMQNIDLEGGIVSMNVHKRRIVTGLTTGRLVLWCADTGKNLLKIDMDIRYRRRGTGVFNLLNVAISDDRVAYGTYDGSFHIFDINTGECVLVLQVTAAQGCRVVWSAEKGHVGPLYGVDYNNDWHVAAVDGNTSSDVEVQQEGLALRHLPLVQQQHHQTRQERIDSFVLPPYTEPQLHKFEENNISNNGNSTLHIEEDEGGEESEDDEEEAGQDEDGEDIIIMENLLRRRDRLEQQLEGQIQRRQRFLHETNITNTLVPMTLSLNSHILVTNGRSNNELSVWDITSEGGRHLYNLSHSFPKRFNNNSTTTAISHQKEVMRDLPFAELAKDGSMIYSCLEQDIDMDNLVSISHGTMMPGGGGALTDEELMEQQQQHLLQRRRQQSATFVWWDFNPNSCSDATSTTTNSTAAVPLLQSQGRQQHQQKSSVINQDLSLVSRPRQRRFQKFFTSLHENSIDFWLCWEEM